MKKNRKDKKDENVGKKIFEKMRQLPKEFKGALTGFALLLMSGKLEAKNTSDFSSENPTVSVDVKKEKGGEGEKKEKTYVVEEKRREVVSVSNEGDDVVVTVRVVGTYDREVSEEELDADKNLNEIEKGVAKVAGAAKEETVQSLEKSVLLRRDEIGPVALHKNSDGKYALQFELKGNTLHVYWNNGNYLHHTYINKFRNVRLYNADFVRKNFHGMMNVVVHANGEVRNFHINL